MSGMVRFALGFGAEPCEFHERKRNTLEFAAFQTFGGVVNQ